MIRLSSLPVSVGLIFLTCAQLLSAIEIRLATENPGNEKKTQFLFSKLGSDDPEIRGGPILAPVVSSAIRGVDGEILITWKASAKTSEQNPETWVFGDVNGFIDTRDKGWGVRSPKEKMGDLQLFEEEAFLIEFDLSEAKIEPGRKLVFRLGVSGESPESFKVYYRKSENSGELVESFIYKEGQSPVTDPIYIEGSKAEFAITEAGFKGGSLLRLYSFFLDTIPVSN
ncbi:MAG: hypothetical protein ACPGN3_14580 [Opitutales bacterium]